MRTKSRGLTLIEVMVATVLGLLALSILTSALIPMMRNTQRSMQRFELSQVAQIASHRLSEDLQSAPPRSIGLPNGSSYFYVQSVQKVTDTGKPVFSDQLILYSVDLAKGRLSRKLCKPADLSLDGSSSYTPAQLADFSSNLAGSTRILFSDCLKEFELKAASLNTPELIQLKFHLQSNLGSYSVEETLALRNSEL